MRPVLMPPNAPRHFYRGGASLARLRGWEPDCAYQPEEWLAATVQRAGDPDHGPSRLPDGSWLADAVSADPIGWLGAIGATASDTGVLVKLLDAGQRLPVHVHPDRAFARAHLNCPYGKTEAWYVLEVAPGGDRSVWAGFSADVDPGELSRKVAAQDSEWMLAQLNRIPVRPGDGILVPAGTPHAIGAGVFVAEVQEPTDFSVLLEWSVTNAGPDAADLGLGFPTALQATNYLAVSPAAQGVLRRYIAPGTTARAPIPLLPEAAAPFFRLHLVAPSGQAAVEIPAGFAVLVVLGGAGSLAAQEVRARAGRARFGRPPREGGTLSGIELRRGQVWAVPAGFGRYSIGGGVQVLLARPSLDWPDCVAEAGAQ